MIWLQGPVVIIYTTSLTFTNSTFCPHSVFMCFVWIWEQTTIISLYSINWLVFITKTECVYCAVRTGSLYIILRSAHSVFMCFVWISEQTAIFFQYTSLTDWFLGAFAEFRKATLSFIMSVRPSVRTEQLSSHCAKCNDILYLNIFSEFCVEKSVFIIIWQEQLVLFLKTCVLLWQYLSELFL